MMSLLSAPPILVSISFLIPQSPKRDFSRSKSISNVFRHSFVITKNIFAKNKKQYRESSLNPNQTWKTRELQKDVFPCKDLCYGINNWRAEHQSLCYDHCRSWQIRCWKIVPINHRTHISYFMFLNTLFCGLKSFLDFKFSLFSLTKTKHVNYPKDHFCSLFFLQI